MPPTDAGENIDDFVHEYFIHVRSSDIGEAIDPALLITLADQIAALPAEDLCEQRDLIEVAAHGLAPVWEANYMVPDQPRSLRLQSFFLHAKQMGPIANPILDRLETIASGIDTEAFIPLVKTLDTWVHAAAGTPCLSASDPDQGPTAQPTLPLAAGLRRDRQSNRHSRSEVRL